MTTPLANPVQAVLDAPSELEAVLLHETDSHVIYRVVNGAEDRGIYSLSKRNQPDQIAALRAVWRQPLPSEELNPKQPEFDP